MSSYSSTGSYFSTMSNKSSTPLESTPGTAPSSNSNNININNINNNPLARTPPPERIMVPSSTAPATAASAGVKPRTSLRNSVVEAMITSNNLRNCAEVEEMVSKCLHSKDDKSFVCKSAKRYFRGGCGMQRNE